MGKGSANRIRKSEGKRGGTHGRGADVPSWVAIMERVYPGALRYTRQGDPVGIRGYGATLRGMGSILEIAPHTPYEHMFPEQSPEEAVYDAFREVGRALESAMGTVANEIHESSPDSEEAAE